MKRALAIIICLFLLATGLARIGVSGLMIGQALQWWTFDGEAVEALADTRRFISEQASNFVGFTPISYFAYIMFMGITISVGAIGQIWRKNWGMALIILYIASHAALFLNFMTINPKIGYVGLAIIAALVLAWANRLDDREEKVLA